jgi:hypothetical protein
VSIGDVCPRGDLVDSRRVLQSDSVAFNWEDLVRSGGHWTKVNIYTNVGEFSVLKNEKVVLAREALKLNDEIVVKVGNHIDVSLVSVDFFYQSKCQFL